MHGLVLASLSPFRKILLENAGLTFGVMPASIDERAIERELEHRKLAPGAVALELARAKALNIAVEPGTHVIGSDQTLSLGDRLFHKPKDMDAAKEHLMAFSGKTHQLDSAVVIARDGKIVWSHLASARMTMRLLSDDFIDRYLTHMGNMALQTVGSYQLEREGIQLFDHIEGDYFTIIGLPILPLLAELRNLGVIDG